MTDIFYGSGNGMYGGRNECWKINDIPSYCISLERRLDRWKRFQSQPALENLPRLQRFVGVDGKTIDLANDKRVTVGAKRSIMLNERRQHSDLNTVGGVGCALSHIAVWQKIVNEKIKVALVCEDDAVLPYNFVENVNSEIANSQVLCDTSKWDMFLLCGLWKGLHDIPGEESLKKIDTFFLFHCYVITYDGAKKLLEYALPIESHIDWWVSYMADVQKFRIVGMKNLRVQQYQVKNDGVGSSGGGGGSDIQTTDECYICNVESDFQKDSVLISKNMYMFNLVCQGALVGTIAYLLLRGRI
jgi:GR25 family glycosyltransferase involved in LPS biosynthesis